MLVACLSLWELPVVVSLTLTMVLTESGRESLRSHVTCLTPSGQTVMALQKAATHNALRAARGLFLFNQSIFSHREIFCPSRLHACLSLNCWSQDAKQSANNGCRRRRGRPWGPRPWGRRADGFICCNSGLVLLLHPGVQFQNHKKPPSDQKKHDGDEISFVL